MYIQNIPEMFLRSKIQNPELYIYDFKMTQDIVKSRVNLSLHMFSFLQTGEKKVQLEDAFVEVNNKQSVLIRSGNCIMTELLDNEQIYFCKLFFFSNKNIVDFLERHPYLETKAKAKKVETPFFVIENDEFIHSFVSSISSVLKLETVAAKPLLSIKFEEIMLYLSQKYGSAFVNYIQSLANTDNNSSFRKIVDANVYSNLSVPEIAFLTNMSLSTFKRHFANEYHENPGKWFQQKRLTQAKKLLDKGEKKPSEVFAAFGYNNLSNFSTAFKNEFGYSPREAKSDTR